MQWLLRAHAHDALEWHREKQYKYAVLRHVAEGIYHHAALPPAALPPAASLAPGEARDDDEALPGAAKAAGPAPGAPSPPREPSPADSSEQAGGEAADSAVAAPASAAPAGKRRSLFSPRALKGAASCSSCASSATPNKSSAAAEAEQGAEHRPAAPAARAVRRMLIQDAIALPELAELAEAEIRSTVIYLSAHYKKLPATGFRTARRAAAAGAAAGAAAAAAAADPSEYHALKEGASKEGGEAAPPAPSNLYDEVASRFEECGVKVTSDGEAAYAADRRAIVLLVLSPELFRCAELVDEIARQLDRQAPAEPRAAKEAHLKQALLGGAAPSSREEPLGVDDVPLELHEGGMETGLDAESRLEACEVGASVVIGVRSARPGPSAETHTARVLKTPRGFGVALDERNKVIGVHPDSQAARGGVKVGDVIVAIDGAPLRGKASSAFGEVPVGTTVTFSLRATPPAFAEAPPASEDEGHSFSVRLTKTAGGFGLGLGARNRVETIAPGSPAAKDGRITVGDTLVSLDGTDLSTVEPQPLTSSQSFNPLALRRKRSFVKQTSKQAVAMSFGMSNAVRNRMQRAGSFRWMRRRKTLVPLYSTACTFAEYVRSCPPDLKELGIFSLPFEKWPEVSAAS